MTSGVIFLRTARREFNAAARWYEQQRTGLGIRFVDEATHAIQRAVQHPERYPVVYRDVRCVRLRRFPYSVFYRIALHGVVVLAVFHARRDPSDWQGRT